MGKPKTENYTKVQSSKYVQICIFFVCLLHELIALKRILEIEQREVCMCVCDHLVNNLFHYYFQRTKQHKKIRKYKYRIFRWKVRTTSKYSGGESCLAGASDCSTKCTGS